MLSGEINDDYHGDVLLVEKRKLDAFHKVSHLIH